MDVLGCFVGGLVYDFNNLLIVIVGNNEMVMEEVLCFVKGYFNEIKRVVN